MADGYDLGTAWIQISPSTRGITSGIQQAIGMVNIDRATSGWKSSVTGAFTGAFSTVKTMAATTFAAVGAVIAANLNGAIKRADTLNAFPLMMKNLGYSTEDASKSMAKMVQNLDGLPTSLDAMAGMVTQLAPLTGGLDKATDLSLAFNNALLAGGKSTVLQTNAMEQYSQMLAVGKVDMMAWRSMVTAMPGQMNQLSVALLGAGHNSMDLYSAMKSGKVSFDQFNKAVVSLNKTGVNGFASFSQQAKDATQGIGTAVENMGTRIRNAMAKVITALGVADIAGIINGISSHFVAFGSDIAGFVTKVKGSPEILGKLQSVLGGLGPVVGAVVGAFSTLVANANIPMISKMFGGISGPAGLIVGAFVQIVANSKALRDSLGSLGGTIKTAIIAALPVVAALMATVGVALGKVGDALAPIATAASALIQYAVAHIGVVVTALSGVGAALVAVTGFLADHHSIVLGVVAAWAAWKVGGVVVDLAKATIALGANSVAWVRHTVALIGDKAESAALALMYGRDFVVNLAKSTAAVVAQSGAWIAQKAVMLAGAAASGVATAAQWALNVAMNANPIGIVVTAIAALIAGLVLFFTKTEVGRKAWASLTAAFKSFIEWIGPGWSTVMNGIGAVWSAVWRGIVTAVKVAITVITTAFLLPFQIAWNVWSAIFGWAYTNLIKPALDAIGLAFTVLYAVAIKPALDAIAAGWNWIAGIASTVWGAITGAVSAAWSIISTVVSTVSALVVGWVIDRFNAIKTGAAVIWGAISSTISTVWGFIKGIVLGAASAVYDYVQAKFTAVKVGAAIIWTAIKSGISSVWTSIKSIAQAGAQWVYDKVSGPFDKLKGFAIKAFEGMRDGIGKAWDGLKAVAAKPVNFLIKTVYTDGIKHLAESVASKIGLKLTLPTIQPLKYATGGQIPGYGGGDRIPALLEAGEFVVNKRATRQHGNLLAALNGGWGAGGQMYADGGIVGWFKDKAKGITDFFSDPLGAVANLITKPVKALMGGVGSGLFADLGKGVIDKILGAIPNFFKRGVEKMGGSSSRLVNAAMRAVAAGVPYVWGGSSVPPGLDCSGLVYWAAQQLGLGWPRLTAAGYQAASVAKPLSNAAPGDLLFWGNPAYHVAIAAGAGQMIEEPKPGLSARRVPIWGNPAAGVYTGKNSHIAAPEYLKYDEGGFLQPGLTLAMNATGKPEPVFTHEQAQGFGLSHATFTDEQIELLAAAVREGADAGVSGRIGSSSRQNVRAVMGV